MKNRNDINILLIGIAIGGIGILSKLVYRPYIISYNVNDFGVQGFAPNFFTVLSLSLSASYFSKQPIKTMIYITSGVIIYEIEQIWTSRIFDYMDIIASVLGLVVAILIHKLMINK